jgi:hypothetical protein
MGPLARRVLIAFGWIAAGVFFWGAAIAVDVSLNLFDWRPRLSFGLVAGIGVYLAALAASVALHPATRGTLPMATAVVVTLTVAAIGLSRLPAETLRPGTLLGRTLASPPAYRVAYALALILPAVLLAVRRWRVDAEDSWFRKRAVRLLPPLVVVALGLAVTGVAGRRAHDPARYDDAAKVLGGPSGIAVAAQMAVNVLWGLLAAMGSTEKRAPQELPVTDYRELLDQFFRSDRVSAPIKDEVRAACSNDENPAEAHACAHDVLSNGRARAERARKTYLWLGLSALPIGALAIAVGWRARRPRENA